MVIQIVTKIVISVIVTAKIKELRGPTLQPRGRAARKRTNQRNSVLIYIWFYYLASVTYKGGPVETLLQMFVWVISSPISEPVGTHQQCTSVPKSHLQPFRGKEKQASAVFSFTLFSDGASGVSFLSRFKDKETVVGAPKPSLFHFFPSPSCAFQEDQPACGGMEFLFPCSLVR